MQSNLECGGSTPLSNTDAQRSKSAVKPAHSKSKSGIKLPHSKRLRRTNKDRPMTKQQIRTEISGKRKALDPHWVEHASAAVVGHFQTLEAFQTSEMVALYKAISGEVILEPLFSSCWELGKRTCIPVFNSAQKIYEMAEITAKTRFETGHYGIQEPVKPALVPVERINLMAVPGVAFDRRGNRLGRGGGYYDRLLAGFGGISAAVAFDFQLSSEIPREPHDLPVDFIVTETKIVKIENEH